MAVSAVRTRRTTWIALPLTVACALAGLAGCSKEAGSEKAFCTDLRKVPTLESVVADYADTDPEELTARIDEAEQAFEQLRTSAPAEIDSDVDAMVDLVDDVLAAVRTNQEDPDTVAKNLREAMRGQLGAAKSSLRVAAYGATKCNVTLNPAELPPESTTVVPGAEVTSTTGG